MLTTLRIKNLALVPDLTLELAPGYNAITGETGAGKSVIIGALSLVLGERADRSLIRAGAGYCTVEAVFSTERLTPRVSALLEEKGIEPSENGQLLLKRTFTATGANRQFVNGSPAALAVLAEIGQWLVDMHGPHEHQSLLRPNRQLEILDAYGGLGALRDGFAKLARERGELLEQKSALMIDERSYAQQLDLLRFQVREITAASLTPGEELGLEAEYARAGNAARLIEFGQAALAALAEDERSVLAQAGAAGRALRELARLDGAARPLIDAHEAAVNQLRDLQRALRQYVDAVEIDPARLRQLEERLNVIQALKRKYGATVDAVIRFGDEARQKLLSLESRDAELERLNAAIAKNENGLWRAGAELSRARREVIPRLVKVVTRELRDLGFTRSSLEIRIASLEREQAFSGAAVNSTGFDAVEFVFAPNPGEPARPLRAIASSGELARVMLALKTVLAAQDEIPLLVFDEVDANIGGETAVAVGEKMRRIGSERQVICITHLAPVAAAASAHFLVLKETREGRTISTLERLEGEARPLELARMLGGGEAALKHARAMLRQK